MPSINGHCHKRAVLYRRVSGEEQKKKGYSLPDQRDEQLAYCALENLEIVREFEDPGYSGKFLDRPDLDELRDLVAAGGVDVVVVSKRDRLARGLYAGYLKNEFKRHGTGLVALDSRTEDTPYGELLENTLDNFSEFERFMIADRMRRGKRSKSKQGKLVACPQSDYGFRYNEARDGYEVDELRMALVRRIFKMVGAEGMTLSAVARRLEAEGIPTPPRWGYVEPADPQEVRPKRRISEAQLRGGCRDSNRRGCSHTRPVGALRHILVRQTAPHALLRNAR